MSSVVLDYRNPPPLFDIGAAWAILWKRRLLVGLVTLGVVGAALLYVVLTPPTYSATTAILVDPRDIKSTNIDNVLPGIGADSAAIASQVSVIESRDLLSKVFAKLALSDDPEFASAGSGLLGFLHASKSPTEEVALQKFMRAVGVEREGLTYVIDVTVKSGSADKAARIANAVVEQYIAMTGAQQSNANTDVTATLNTKIAALQSDVAAAERAVADFRQQHGIFDETTGGTLQSQIDAVSTQIVAAQDALNQAQAKVDQAKAAGTSPDALLHLSDVWSSPAMEGLRTDYNTRSATLASAQATLGPRHPTVIKAQAELDRVQSLLSREAARISRELTAGRDLAEVNLAKLEASLSDLRKKSSDTSIAQVQLRQLQGKADAAHAVLSDFLQRSQETSQIEGLQNQQVHVISQAAAPTEATWPKPNLLLPVSAALGLLLGSGLALMLGGRTAIPAPTPTPIVPERSRRDNASIKPRPEPVPRSSAQRYANLDVMRREIFSPATTPITTSVQILLRDVLALLPDHGGPFVLSFSARDRKLARYGAEIAAMGVERIGSRALLVNQLDIGTDASQYRFIFVTDDHNLAAAADLAIEVLDVDEAEPAIANPNTIAFRLPPAPPQRPTLVGKSATITAAAS
jgi:uncharacterized protein involved in exopolysaccharide biosynthesis